MKNTLILLFLLVAFGSLRAQNARQYLYDAAGNRIVRQVKLTFQEEVVQARSSENKENATFSLAPNPTTGIVTMRLASGEVGEKPLTALVFDVQGRLVLSESFKNTEHTVQFGALPNGLYVLYLKREHEVLQVWKVVKE